MKSLLLISILVSAIAIPAIAARDPRPRRGILWMVLALLAFNAAYAAYVMLIHVRLFVPHWP